MNNKDIIILKKILSEMQIIESLILELNAELFLKDEKSKRAVCMTLINIGELVKNLDDDIRTQHKSIPWREISGMRDIAAHKYQTLKMERVWNTVRKDIPEFKKHLENILAGI
ncbi:MAG: DUF86 domain-containing protein [Dysgonamonadaceae bacterium]|nr:DUF86 domain-containing protein [Dysgonamonadaceae bacterium]